MTPDALDLERIGRALWDEFTEPVPPEDCCDWCGHGLDDREPTFVTGSLVINPQPGRTDAERLVRVLSELGFEIRRAS